MNSLTVLEFRLSIERYIEEQKDIPAEVKRLVLQGVLNDVTQKATEEARAELLEREANENEHNKIIHED